MGYSRDPVSVAFDNTAAALLQRAYGQRGQWVTVRLKDPTMRQRTRWAEQGINVDGPDNPSSTGGQGLDAKSRWARGLVRSLYYWHKHGHGRGALQVEVGRHIPASPQFDPRYPERGGFPPSRQVRIRIAAGGQAARRAANRLPDSRRIVVGDLTAGEELERGPRWADPERRDWAQ